MIKQTIKKHSRVIGIIGFSFLSLNGHAATTPVGEGNISWMSVETSGIYIQISDSSNTLITNNSQSCTFSHIYAFTYENGNAGSSEAMYSALLAAYTAKTPVNVFVNGCSAPPLSSGYPVINTIQAGSFQSPPAP